MTPLVLQVGDVVSVGRACLNNPAHVRAVVIEVYALRVGPTSERPGWTLLFPSGAADGFSPGDCDLFAVRYLEHDGQVAGYHFLSMIQLQRDVRAGRFASVWRSGELAEAPV
jgi:hypothetical protein